MKTILVIFLITAQFAVAAPISPVMGYNTTNHNQVELKHFWSTLSWMDSRMKGKDCFKRAMLWSYKLDKRFGVKSKKVFMHYTDKFNRELDDQGRAGLEASVGRLFSRNDGWDFHVAPVVKIDGRDVVLDPRMRNRPESIENWVEYLTSRGEWLLKRRHYKLLKKIKRYRKRFSRDKLTEEQIKINRRKLNESLATLKYLGLSENPKQKVDIKCEKITHIMEFDRNQENAWCYYQETSMYYFGPLELRYLNYGDIPTDKRYPVTELSYHNDRSYRDGANYVVRKWDFEKLAESLDEFKFEHQPLTTSGI